MDFLQPGGSHGGHVGCPGHSPSRDGGRRGGSSLLGRGSSFWGCAGHGGAKGFGCGAGSAAVQDLPGRPLLGREP